MTFNRAAHDKPEEKQRQKENWFVFFAKTIALNALKNFKMKGKLKFLQRRLTSVNLPESLPGKPNHKLKNGIREEMAKRK